MSLGLDRSAFRIASKEQLDAAQSPLESAPPQPAVERLRVTVEHILENAALRTPLDLSLSGNLFQVQALLWEGSLAYRLGDERLGEVLRNCVADLADQRRRDARLPNEVHLAFALTGLCVAIDLGAGALDEDLARAAVAAIAAKLHAASLREEWGDRLPKRNAWNHTAVAYAALGCAGIVCAGSHPDAERWLEDALERTLLYFRDGVTESGMTREGLAYCGFAFRNLAPFLLAARQVGIWDYRAPDENPFVERLRRIPSWYALEVFPTGSWLQNINDSYWSPHQALWGFLPVFGPLEPQLTAWVHDRLVGPGGSGTEGQDVTLRTSALFESLLFAPPRLDAEPALPELLVDPDVGFVAEREREAVRGGFSFNCGPYLGGIHDQSDNGSVTLFAFDLPLLIDSGAANRAVEGSAGSSHGHSVMLVDGRGQYPAGTGAGCSGAMLGAARSSVATWVSGDLTDAYQVRNYNYVRHGIRHCVFAKRPIPYLLVVDDFARPGAAPALYEQLFHTPPATETQLGNGRIRLALEFADRAANLTLLPLGRPAEIDQIDFSASPQPPFPKHPVVRIRRRGGHMIMATLVVPHEGVGLPDLSGEVDEETGSVTVRWRVDGRTGVDVLSFSPAEPVPASFTRDARVPAGTEILLPASPPGDRPRSGGEAEPGAPESSAEAAAGLPTGARPRDATSPGESAPDPDGARRRATPAVVGRLAKRFVGRTRPQAPSAPSSAAVVEAAGADPATEPAAGQASQAEEAIVDESPDAGKSAAAAETAITPSRQRRVARLVGSLEEIRSDPDYPTPPERGIVMGNADFRSIGAEFLDHFVGFADLDPDADVLDAGCGGGRMAAALLYYLRYGSYVGFDVHDESIAWCREAIVPRNPRFGFDHVDLHNQLYRPDSAGDAAAHRFPYEDERFDFIIATSLFTHMFRDEVQNYLGEFRRVLRRGGVVFATAYLLNPNSMIAMLDGDRAVSFPHVHRDSAVLDADRPAAGVAHSEDWLLADARGHGLSVDRIAYGAWTGQERLSKQDVVLLRRDL